MNELGPDAKELLEAGRNAFRPSIADRERVFLAIAPQLGSAIVPKASPALTHGAGQAALVKWSLGMLVGGLVVGGVYFGIETTALVVPTAPSSLPVVSPAETVTEAAVASAPNPPAVESVDRPPEVRTPPANDHLDEEVAILSRAGAALRSGQPKLALKALNEHQKRFPSGVLAQERSAARVQALCALGRMSEGRAELARLEKRAPRSPLTARARKACGVGGDPRD